MAESQNIGIEQVTNLLRHLSATQKATLALFVILATAVILGASYFLGQEEFQVLYSGMNPEDTGVVIERLKELKIPYRVEVGGSAISVPADRLDELRVQLASGGLPSSGKIGFEIFDRSNFGMSEFTEQINFRRALEGELARSIVSLTEVGTARVHLVLPKTALFQKQEEPAKASVVVKLRSGKTLSEENVFGIRYLVASAVPGLDPANITIMDVRGNVLSLPSKKVASGRLTPLEADHQTSLEKELNSKILSILEPVVGKGKVTANTSVELDLDRVEETSETYDPESTVVTQRQVSRDLSGKSDPAGGAPGVPRSPDTDSVTEIPAKRDRQDETTQFEVSKTVRHKIQASGTVRKLSVAVIVDDKLVYTQNEEGERVPSYVSRTPEELRKIRDLVTAAVGYDESRGDQVTVENLPFQTLDVPAEEEPVSEPGWGRYVETLKPAGRYIAVSLVVLFGYLMLLRPVKHRVLEVLQEIPREPAALLKSTGQNQTETHASLPSSHTDEAARRLAEVERELEEQIENELSHDGLDPDSKKAQMIKRRIREMASEKPQETAQLIRTWLLPQGGNDQ